jgi:hypothetical protein
MEFCLLISICKGIVGTEKEAMLVLNTKIQLNSQQERKKVKSRREMVMEDLSAFVQLAHGPLDLLVRK